MSNDPILYEVDGHVVTITTNRPERFNSLNYEAYRLLTQYLSDADADPAVRAIIWTGNGRGFCTGDDVKELLGAGAEELSRRISVVNPGSRLSASASLDHAFFHAS